MLHSYPISDLDKGRDLDIIFLTFPKIFINLIGKKYFLMVVTMSTQSTVFIPDTTFKSLEQLVPEPKRLAFINNAIIEALQQISKERAIDALANFPRVKGTGKSVVETLQEIRQQESDKLTNK